jgi:hypothetical protein
MFSGWEEVENLEDEEDEETAAAAGWIASIFNSILTTCEAWNERCYEHRLYRLR